MQVLGEGYFGEGNYFIGKDEPDSDLSLPSAPVFALGTLDNGTEQFDIIIHAHIQHRFSFNNRQFDGLVSRFLKVYLYFKNIH